MKFYCIIGLLLISSTVYASNPVLAAIENATNMAERALQDRDDVDYERDEDEQEEKVEYDQDGYGYDEPEDEEYY